MCQESFVDAKTLVSHVENKHQSIQPIKQKDCEIDGEIPLIMICQCLNQGIALDYCRLRNISKHTTDSYMLPWFSLPPRM